MYVVEVLAARFRLILPWRINKHEDRGVSSLQEKCARARSNWCAGSTLSPPNRTQPPLPKGNRSTNSSLIARRNPKSSSSPCVASGVPSFATGAHSFRERFLWWDAGFPMAAHGWRALSEREVWLAHTCPTGNHAFRRRCHKPAVQAPPFPLFACHIPHPSEATIPSEAPMASCSTPIPSVFPCGQPCASLLARPQVGIEQGQARNWAC
jgi:hypothetical protein